MKPLFALLIALVLAVPSFAQAPLALPVFDPSSAPKPPEAAEALPSQPDEAAEEQARREFLKQGFSEEELAKIRDISAFIRANYVDEVDRQKLFYGALKGMMSTLDPHSIFFTPEEFKQFNRDLQGSYAGIGIVMKKKNAGEPIIVQTVVPGGPAEKAGVKNGDQVVEVDGKSVMDMTDRDVASAVRGDPGSKVRLKVRRLSGKDYEFKKLQLTRAELDMPVTFMRMLAGGVGYLNLSVFSPDSAAKAASALDALGAQGMKALVIDLRGNPGGSLDAVARISALFLKENDVIVSIKARRGPNEAMKTHFDGPLSSLPLAVLVDGNSASASEIFSGAMQDHKRGLIIGMRTYGKGTVQQVVPLPDGSGMKLTQARYYLPSGRSIDGHGSGGGIEPDLKIDLSDEQEGEILGRLYRRRLGQPSDGQAPGADPALDAALQALAK